MDLAGKVPTVNYAFFGMLDDLDTGQADNFAYDVPEPMTLGVLAIGALAVVRRRRTA